MRRCDWASNELAIRYHDEEWGMPVHDDSRWFEFLILEGAPGRAQLGHDSQEAAQLPRPRSMALIPIASPAMKRRKLRRSLPTRGSFATD